MEKNEEDSIRRPEEFKRLINEAAPGRFEIVIPEVLESKLGNSDIYNRDIKALINSDIIIGDRYNQGLLSTEGREKLKRVKKITQANLTSIIRDHTIRCHGTLEEIGHAKALGKYVVEITRYKSNQHPFVEGADYVTNNLEDVVDYLVRKFIK